MNMGWMAIRVGLDSASVLAIKTLSLWLVQGIKIERWFHHIMVFRARAFGGTGNIRY